jgi:hypothetical protein
LVVVDPTDGRGARFELHLPLVLEAARFLTPAGPQA